eukprot:352287-Rhodomonas_salina.5
MQHAPWSTGQSSSSSMSRRECCVEAWRGVWGSGSVGCGWELPCCAALSGVAWLMLTVVRAERWVSGGTAGTWTRRTQTL